MYATVEYKLYLIKVSNTIYTLLIKFNSNYSFYQCFYRFQTCRLKVFFLRAWIVSGLQPLRSFKTNIVATLCLRRIEYCYFTLIRYTILLFILFPFMVFKFPQKIDVFVTIRGSIDFIMRR